MFTSSVPPEEIPAQEDVPRYVSLGRQLHRYAAARYTHLPVVKNGRQILSRFAEEDETSDNTTFPREWTTNPRLANNKFYQYLSLHNCVCLVLKGRNDF